MTPEIRVIMNKRNTAEGRFNQAVKNMTWLRIPCAIAFITLVGALAIGVREVTGFSVIALVVGLIVHKANEHEMKNAMGEMQRLDTLFSVKKKEYFDRKNSQMV